MPFKILDKESAELVSQWHQSYRLEEMTCREIVDGKRIVRLNESVNFIYFTEDNSDAVGNIFYFDINDRNKSAEFGYVINPLFKGKGFGIKMVRDFLDYVFTKTDFNRLYAQTASFNTASCKMLERLGFVKDGILREHHELDGKFYDDFIYSILKKEWFKS